MGKLSALKAKAINKPGMHCDGDGLYLQVRSATQRSWVFRYKRHNRSHMMGLGAFPDVALSEARERAAAARKVLRDGLDPLTRRAEQRTGAQTVAITFCDAVAQYVDAYRAGWQSQKATGQWSASLEQHAAFIMKLPVAAIDTDAVRKVLTPIWNCKTETASRVQGRIERVIDYATTRG